MAVATIMAAATPLNRKTSGLAAGALLLLASVPAHATTSMTQDSFTSSSLFTARSFGGSGKASVKKAFSTSWGSGSPSLGTGITNILGTRYGYDAYLETRGSAGVTFSASAALAPIDIDYTASGTTLVTPMGANEFFIKTTFANSGAPKFTIAAPEASAQVNANFSFANNFFGRACFVNCTSWGTYGGANLGSVSANTTLLGLSTKAGGTLTVLGKDFETAPQISVGNYGSISLKPPSALTSRAVTFDASVAHASDKVLEFKLDLAQMTADSVLGGLPLSGSSSFGIGSIDYGLLSLDAVLKFQLTQSASVIASAVRKTSFFNYDGSDAYVPVAQRNTYTLIPGATFSVNGGAPQSCAARFGGPYPFYGAPPGSAADCFQVKGNDFISLHTIDNLEGGMVIGDGFADISNVEVMTETIHSLAVQQTYVLEVGAGLDISALSAKFSIGYGDISIGKEFGPVFESNPTFWFYQPLASREFVRREESYEFVSLTGSAGTPVPEPASWAMLIAGFGLTGATMRRRRTLAVALHS